MWLADLPYCTDSAILFEALAGRPWSVFLDSGRPYSTQGRYDILAADPVATIATWGAMTESRVHGLVRISPDDPFQLLRNLIDETDRGEEQALEGLLPFAGGALGYFAYDLGRRLEKLPAIAQPSEPVPEMAFGIYDRAIIVFTSDHGEAFREHWQLGHTSALYEEEIHVQGWIDAQLHAVNFAQIDLLCRYCATKHE